MNHFLNKAILHLDYINLLYFQAFTKDTPKKMLSGGGLQDQMLKSYIDQIFGKYDLDNSGTLDSKEMTLFFNDLFKSLNMPITVN